MVVCHQGKKITAPSAFQDCMHALCCYSGILRDRMVCCHGAVALGASQQITAISVTLTRCMSSYGLRTAGSPHPGLHIFAIFFLAHAFLVLAKAKLAALRLLCCHAALASGVACKSCRSHVRLTWIWCMESCGLMTWRKATLLDSKVLYDSDAYSAGTWIVQTPPGAIHPCCVALTLQSIVLPSACGHMV